MYLGGIAMLITSGKYYLEDCEINLGSLNTLHRILLTTDGTLTEILEAYFLEQLQLIKLSEEFFTQQSPLPQLDLSGGESGIVRRILLQGERTKRNYIFAESVVVLDRLDPHIRHKLMHTQVTIGRIWIESRLETFKEFIRARYEPAKELSEMFKISAHDTLISRTYRVIVKGRPVMMITEKFPLSL
jgi:chorismate-pyruvate lyase